MKLVLYSGGQNRENHSLHRSVAALCGRKTRIRLTYIPFCADNSNLYFQRIVRRYRAVGITDFHCMPADLPFTETSLRRTLSSDVVYLAGGNTFYFLKSLKDAGLMAPLRRFAREGGVLAGLSAGALILTPTIALASIPGFDADENEVGLKDLRGLGLTSFEFSPHYSPGKKRDESLLAYSRRIRIPVYASPDGGGIVIDGDRFTSQGRIVVFKNGSKYRLS